MATSVVMRHHPHGRFFVNGRGELIERVGDGRNNRTGIGIVSSRASRTEIKVLADLLNNEPGLVPGAVETERLWAQRIEEQRHAR